MKVDIPDDCAYLVVRSNGRITMEPPMTAKETDIVPSAWIYAAAILAYMNTQRMQEALKPLRKDD